MRKIIILALMSISLMACNNDNEKAMQDALNKAGIKISQQDSIIAAQTYKRDYVLTYVVDTCDFKVDHDTIVSTPSDTTYTWDGKLGRLVWIWKYNNGKGKWELPYGNGYRGYAKTLHFKNKSEEYMDSVIKSIHKTTLSINNFIMRTDVDTVMYDKNYKQIAIPRTKKVCRQIFVRSFLLKKEYNNLYSSPKSE